MYFRLNLWKIYGVFSIFLQDIGKQIWQDRPLCTDITLQTMMTSPLLGDVRNLWLYLDCCKTCSNQIYVAFGKRNILKLKPLHLDKYIFLVLSSEDWIAFLFRKIVR